MSLSESVKKCLELSGFDYKRLLLFYNLNDSDKFIIVDKFYKTQFSSLNISNINKSNKDSENIRKKGNELYEKFFYWEALNYYNKSIAYALNNSAELCLAYGNRASCLLRLNYINEALMDIETALSICISDNYKNKLLKKKKNAEVKLSNDDAHLISSFGNGNIPHLSRKQSLLLDGASEIVELAYDTSWGKNLVVNDNVKVGEILIIEKPYSSLVFLEYLYSHCSKCFKRSVNLFPCKNCVTAMFCSKQCLNSANHSVECSYLNILHQLKAGSKELLSLKTLMVATKNGRKLEKLYNQLKNVKSNYKKFYSSKDFLNIFNLITNYEKRSAKDLLNRALVSVILISVLEKHTNFFSFTANERRPILKEFCWNLVFKFLQSMPCNAHSINEYHCYSHINEIGAGAYAVLSLINHSCNPNVVRYSFKDNIVLKAIRPICKGEQLFDNYGQHYAVHALEERQNALLEQYYFKCQCEACVHNWPIYLELALKQSFKLTESVNQLKEDYAEVTKGNISDEIIERNIEYLHYLHNNVDLPYVNYSQCQELLKECWSFHYNYFRP